MKNATSRPMAKFFVFFCFILTLPVSTWAQEGTFVNTPSSVTVEPDGTFSVRIDVQTGGLPVDGAEVHLDFDASILQVSEVTVLTTELPLPIVPGSFDNVLGQIDYVRGSFGPFPTEDFDFIEIDFQVIGSGSTTISYATVFPRKTNMTSGGSSIIGSPDPIEVEIAAQTEEPIASFTANPTSGTAALLVSVDASASLDPDGGTIVSYDWDFGDTNTASGVTADHNYTVPNSYTITLTVTDDEGETATATKLITVDGITITSYTVTASTGPNGSIDPVTALVGEGANQIFTITPDAGYEIAEILVGGTSVAISSPFELTNVQADTNVSVSFGSITEDSVPEISLEATATVDENGNLSVPLLITDEDGDALTVTITSVSNEPQELQSSNNGAQVDPFPLDASGFLNENISSDLGGVYSSNLVFAPNFGDGGSNGDGNGVYTITVSVTDEDDNTIDQTLNLTVNDVYQPISEILTTTIQAESYDNQGPVNPGSGSNGIGVEDNTPGGGVVNIGFTTNGDFVEYLIDVETAGTYSFDFFVAKAGGPLGTMTVNGGPASISVPDNGNWQQYSAVNATVVLPAGQQTLRFDWSGPTGFYFNMDYIEVSFLGEANNPPTIEALADVELDEGETVGVDVQVTDDNNSPLEVALEIFDKSVPGGTNDPFIPVATISGYSFTDNGGGSYTLSWDTASTDGRSYEARVTADDGVNAVVTETFAINVAQDIPDVILARTFSSPLPWYGNNPQGDFTVSIEGGGNIGWTENGEFVEYLIDVPTAGDYNFRVSASKGNTSSGLLTVSEENAGSFSSVGTVTIAQTGWGSYNDYETPITFTNPGLQALRFDFSGGMNISEFELTPISVSDTDPVVSISEPIDGTIIDRNVTTTFTGSATDVEDDDTQLTASLIWSSATDPSFAGTGGTFADVLFAPGTHVLEARVTDSDDNTVTESITVTVPGPVVDFTLPAEGQVLTDTDVRMEWTAVNMLLTESFGEHFHLYVNPADPDNLDSNDRISTASEIGQLFWDLDGDDGIVEGENTVVIIAAESLHTEFANPEARDVVTFTVCSTTINDIAVSDPTECGTENGEITIDATGTNLEYSIDNGTTFGSSNTFSALAAGTFDIVVRKIGETTCRASSTATLQEPQGATPIVTGPTTYLQGSGGVTLDAGAGFASYLWSNNETTQTITVLEGIYTVTVTEANGCEGTSIGVIVTEEDDAIDPEITCVGDVAVNADTGVCGAEVSYQEPVATDNVAGVTLQLVDGLPNGSVVPVGETAQTYVATDAQGNTASCSFIITVSDIENPIVDCSDDISMTIAFGATTGVVDFVVPSFSDNCPGTVLTQTAGLPSGSDFPVGITVNTFEAIDASGNIAICSFEVNVVEDPGCTNVVLAVQTATNPTGCDRTDGSIVLNVTGTTADLDYDWGHDTDLESATATGLSKGIYSVTVTGAGCTKTINVELEDPAIPSVTLAPFADIALNTSPISLTGGSPTGGTYSGTGVNNGNFNPSIGVGTYDMVYTFEDSVTGCTNTASQSITVTDTPVANSPLTVLNANTDTPLFALTDGLKIQKADIGNTPLGIVFETETNAGSVKFTLTGPISRSTTEGVAPFSLYGDIGVDIQGRVFPIGEYTLVADPANGPTVTVNFEVTNIDPLCQNMNVTVQSKTDPTTCNLADGSIVVLVTGTTGNLDFEWSHDTILNSATATGLTSGNYTVKVTNVNGCSNTVSVVLESPAVPSVSLTAFADILTTASPLALTGGSPIGGTYSGPGVSNGSFDPSIGAGSYDIVYTFEDAATGCGATATRPIRVTAPVIDAALIVLDANTDVPLFALTDGLQIQKADIGNTPLGIVFEPDTNPGSVRFILTGPISRNTSEGRAPFSLYGDIGVDIQGRVFPLGEYTLVADPANGPTVTVNFEITDVDPLCGNMNVTVQSKTDPASCNLADGSIDILVAGATGNLDFEWSHDPALSESIATGLSAGNYAVTVTDANGCTKTVSTTLKAPTKPLVSLLPFADIRDSAGAIALSGGSPVGGTYSGLGVDSSGNFDPSIGAGTYAILYSYVDAVTGCENSAVRNIRVTSSSILTVSSLTLVNADTDQDILTITNGMAIELSSLSTLNLDIRANVTADVESVLLELSGAKTNNRTENIAPYALYGDSPTGDYIGSDFTVGAYTINATPYTGNGLKGVKGATVAVEFTLVQGVSLTARTAGRMMISPNPAIQRTTVSFPEPVQLTQFFVYDITGRLVKTISSETAENIESIELSVYNLPIGTYFVRTTDTSGQGLEQRLIIEK